MRRNGYIVLLVAVLAWAVAAIVRGSPSLGLFGASASTSDSERELALVPAGDARTQRELPGTDVDVSPAPGTDTANPDTQISFLGTRREHPRGLGRRLEAGDHGGHLHGYSQGDGASFVPDKPFDAGERVLVRARDRCGAARQAGRLRLSRRHALSDGERAGVPQPAGGARRLPELRHAARRAGADPDRHRARPRSRRPATSSRPTGPGPGQYGPLIYTPQGRLVWFDKLSDGETAEDLNEQTYEGQRDLTWWQGRVLSLGFGQGEDIVMNSRYQTVARVAGGNGLQADLHDFQIAPHDIAYITAFNPIRCDLSAVEGRARRRDHRHGDPGDRHEDGPRALGMAQPRPRRRRRVRGRSADERDAVGLVPPQLDRSRARRRHLHLGAQHLGRLPAGRRHAAGSSGASAA